MLNGPSKSVSFVGMESDDDDYVTDDDDMLDDRHKSSGSSSDGGRFSGVGGGTIGGGLGTGMGNPNGRAGVNGGGNVGHPNSSNSSDNKHHHERKAVKRIARTDTWLIRTSHVLVLAVILTVGVVVTIRTINFMRDNEDDRVKSSYNFFVDRIRATSEKQLEETFESVRAMAEKVSAHATSAVTNQSFPYVTMTYFEVEGHHMRTQTAVEIVLYSPLVRRINDWSSFASVEKQQQWMIPSWDIYRSHNPNETDRIPTSMEITAANMWAPTLIYEIDEDEDGGEATTHFVESTGSGPFAPVWQVSPPPSQPNHIVNYNLFAHSFIALMVGVLDVVQEGLFTQVVSLPTVLLSAIVPNQAEFDYIEHANDAPFKSNDNETHPESYFLQPIFGRGNSETSMVAILTSVFAWDQYLSHLVPDGIIGIWAILHNNCGQAFSYLLNGTQALYVGEGDFHDPKFDSTINVIPLNLYRSDKTMELGGHCVYSLHIYSSKEFEDTQKKDVPMALAFVVAVIFAIVAGTIFSYDGWVRSQLDKVVNAAARSNAILSSLFPTSFRDRLFQAADTKAGQSSGRSSGGMSGGSHHTFFESKTSLKSYLSTKDMGGSSSNVVPKTARDKPIADLFTETTILFADIVGFTAWSSVREPTQVFMLLETLFQAFDEIAKRRHVFKVETVGDCYVAVTGLPDPQQDHAVIMARFARDCMFRMKSLARRLEVSLGPDTGDLSMRMGIHSGPVTAGVLRGERSRFQLFGDTMNTASRMESTGLAERIQVSQETADLLVKAGKSEWITERDEKIVAKGKGELQTYWLVLGRHSGGSKESSTANNDDGDSESGKDTDEEEEDVGMDESSNIFDGKTARLIDWMVDILIRLLKQIDARRRASISVANLRLPNEERYLDGSAGLVIDEVKEIITLPNFSARTAQRQEETDSEVELDDAIIDQLHDYVCNIAANYRHNPFHNFEHASHVTMSVVKLMSRIVAPSDLDLEECEREARRIASTLHDHTYGITSDPLTQFACVFSALIHDVDHSGVPNAQLVKENSEIAQFYHNKSVAEQNSVDLAWNLLMDDAYQDLRAVIYTTDTELQRFRALVVNSVMATDIVDKELKTLRNQRWERAFAEKGHEAGSDAAHENPRDAVNRKATIVIEHLIQASDVAHTMQHWHIYRKWNARFFEECYHAYKDGRADKDPAENWYEGELGFFDFYIIPLAKKLKDCGVFGVSSDEYLNYAIRNRKEWEERGREIVSEMVEKVNAADVEAENNHHMDEPGMLRESSRDALTRMPSASRPQSFTLRNTYSMRKLQIPAN